MTEGNGTYADVQYLMRRTGETVAAWHTRIRGVSAHVVITDDGTVYQMVDFDHAAGSFNPNDRQGATTGYYHWPIIRDVLGTSYIDPNACSIVAEIAGKRATGPNDKQVRAAIAWANDMKNRYPTIRGAFGHADQTDTKGCPGTTVRMRSIFDAIGGHGRWKDNPDMLAITSEVAHEITVAKGANFYDLDGKTVLAVGSAALDWRSSPFACGSLYATYATIGGARRVILVKPTGVRGITNPCDDAITKAIAADRAKAHIVYE